MQLCNGLNVNILTLNTIILLILLMDGLMMVDRFVRAQFMRGVVKHWPLDPLVLGAFAGFHAYQVCKSYSYTCRIYLS